MDPITGGISRFSSGSKISTALRQGKITISDDWGIAIINPEILVSPTKVAESCNCVRRGVIADRAKSFGDLSAAAVMGNTRHNFIEVCLDEAFAIIQFRSFLILLPFIRFLQRK